MTSSRTDARAAAAERRAAASSPRLVAFEPDAAVETPPPAPRRRAASPAAEVEQVPRSEFSRKTVAATSAPAVRANTAKDVPSIERMPPADVDSSGPGWFGWAIGAGWFAAASILPVGIWGLAPVLAQPPAFLAGLVALAVFPAIGFVMGVSAARDAATARALALRLMAERTAEPSSDAAAWRAARSDAEDAAVAVADLLARERAAADDVATALKAQTDAAAQAARRQVGLMREASRLVTEEARAIETTLAEAMAAVSGAQAALRANVETGEALRQRLDAAAETAAETQRLVEDSTAAAFDAADAVRAATHAAMDDARRAAEVLRAESEAARTVMQEALSALDRAAQSARAEARAAADFDRRSNDAQTVARAPLRRAMRPQTAAAPEAPARRAPSIATQDAGARDTMLAHDLNLSWMSRASSTGVDMLETMGVSLADAIADVHLAGIARRARLGVGARRRAVVEAAPDIVDLIGRVCDRDERVHRAAAAFRRDPGFDTTAPMDEWPVDGEAARAYLLVDAALG
ncbi:MAG: hypothetical protein KJS97_05880 [Alphaproteobacteria bacterium]|nr:hypothetical protein [Alphaproteobacteria bacterium]